MTSEFPRRWTEPGEGLKRPHVIDKVKNDRAREKAKRKVYAEVDARDGKKCQCCGRRGNPDAITTLGRIHRAHIHDAGTRGPMTATNLLSLCWICAALETAKQLFIIGKNANRQVRFEIMEVAVEEVFGSQPLPSHVTIVLKAPRQRYGS